MISEAGMDQFARGERCHKLWSDNGKGFLVARCWPDACLRRDRGM